MKFESRIFNNIEYTLVDIYDWKTGEKIYHFASDEDYLFCFKKNENYIVIEEKELVQEIKDEYDLNPDVIWYIGLVPNESVFMIGTIVTKTLGQKEKQTFREEQLNKLEELNSGISRNVLEKRLSRADICSAVWLPKSHFRAYYHSLTNAMYFKKSDLTNNTVDCKRVRLHEAIHAITGAIALLRCGTYGNKKGFVEGATENIVEKLYGNQTSSYYHDIHFNLSHNTTYKYPVSIIRQMELALGKPCDQSILLGKLDFFKEFGNRYGRDFLRVLSHRTSKLKTPNKMKNAREYFLETQRMIMEVVFDRDVFDVTDIDSAKTHLDKLIEYGSTRGEAKDDSYYTEYYQKRVEQLKQILQEKGYDTKEIEEYRERKPEFYPLINKEYAEQILNGWVLANLSNEIKKPEDVSTEILRYRIGMGQGEKEIFYFLAKDNAIYRALKQNRYTGKTENIIFDPPMQQEDKETLGICYENKNEQYSINITEVDYDWRTKKFQEQLSRKIRNKCIESERKAAKQKKAFSTLAFGQRISKVAYMLGEVKKMFYRDDVELEQQTNQKNSEKKEDIDGIR